MTIRCMRIACRVPKATNTDSEYVVFKVFSRNEWLHESTSMCHLCVQYIASIFTFTVGIFILLNGFLQRNVSQVRKHDVIAQWTVLTF